MLYIAAETVSTYMGYGRVAIGASRALTAAGIRHIIVARRVHTDYAPLPADIVPLVAIVPEGQIPVPEEADVIQITPPTKRPPKCRRAMLWSFWEVDPLPPWSGPILSAFDAVIVSSRWNKTLFEKAAPGVRCEVVPLGVDTRIFNPTLSETLKPHNGHFVVGTSGRVAKGGIRKGVDLVSTAFGAMTTDCRHVTLEVKVLPDQKPLEAMSHTYKTHEIINECLSDDGMAGWYSGLDLYVSGSAGEGFGLQCLEAMACGTPVASVQHGGVTDFWNDYCGPVLPHKETEARGNFYKGWGATWKEPTIDGIVEAMNTAMANPEWLAKCGRRAAERAREFSVERMNAAFVSTVGSVWPEYAK